MTERIWTIAAALLVLVAGVCLWRNYLSVAFVTATLGACAWFLSYRAQLRPKVAAQEEHEAEIQTDEDTDED